MDEKKVDKDINVRSKPTDEEIIQALKKQPPYDTVLWLEKCINATDILDLIHSQKAEIERLTEENGQIFDKIYDFIEFRQKRMVEPYKDALTYILRELKEEFGGKNETV